MENFEKLKGLLEAVTPDVDKASNGNKAAAIRVRKALQEVKKLAQLLRVEISALKEKK